MYKCIYFIYVYIYILVWTRAYPCTEQGRAERCATEWSVREHRLLEQLPRMWLRMPFWARLRAFMPSLLRSFASLRPRGRTNPNSLSTSSQYRSKYTWEIHSKINEKSIQNRGRILRAKKLPLGGLLDRFWIDFRALLSFQIVLPPRENTHLWKLTFSCSKGAPGAKNDEKWPQHASQNGPKTTPRRHFFEDEFEDEFWVEKRGATRGLIEFGLG